MIRALDRDGQRSLATVVGRSAGRVSSDSIQLRLAEAQLTFDLGVVRIQRIHDLVLRDPPLMAMLEEVQRSFESGATLVMHVHNS